MDFRTTESGVAGKPGGFSPRMAALAALAGLAIGLALVQAGPWRGDASEEAPTPAAVVTAPARGVTQPEGPALTGGEGEFFTEQQAIDARKGNDTTCGVRVDQTAC
jgi:hypothetical protein